MIYAFFSRAHPFQYLHSKPLGLSRWHSRLTTSSLRLTQVASILLVDTSLGECLVQSPQTHTHSLSRSPFYIHMSLDQSFLAPASHTLSPCRIYTQPRKRVYQLSEYTPTHHLWPKFFVRFWPGRCSHQWWSTTELWLEGVLPTGRCQTRPSLQEVRATVQVELYSCHHQRPQGHGESQLCHYGLLWEQRTHPNHISIWAQ